MYTKPVFVSQEGRCDTFVRSARALVGRVGVKSGVLYSPPSRHTMACA